ncbi:kinetochore-associated protein 1-like [Ctenocephalides felis]|uniref:kinetochore-associated protein 1-like n=1 Tax=Ctenocephalides felis TaxID=7515 RepID=UPI000E6E2ACF|nr:kinetochore-associated protein 1-like [Ctenocephalides felis]
MALWSKVTNCDLDCETVSFGTRQFAQANGALYECSTLAVITPDSEEAKTPHIKSICCDSFIYLAIDNSFTILSGESCVHERSDIYEAPIDCFSVNKAMKMIILCFQNGQIFGLDVQDHALLFEVVLEHEGTYEGKAFITIVEEHEYCVIIASSGAAYRLSKDFDTSVESNHTKFSFEAVNDIKLNIPYPVAAVPGENNYSYVFGGQRIEIANYDDVFSVPMLNSKIKKMATVDGFSNIFCLLSDGTLNTLCYYSLYMSPRKLDYFVDDFVIIKTPDTDTCNLLMSCDNNKRLMLAEYPSMKEIYSIHVKNKIELIDFIDIPMDIKFIEYVGDSINCPEIRIRALVETHPELRVQRLITRGRFDEAETLVKQFKLSMDEINKAKATLELKKYWESVSNISDETFDKLISLLDSIKDNSCIADWCLQALHNEVCDTKSMKKLLHYVINRIKDHFELENYSKRFQDTLLRLETYNLLSLRMNIPWAQFRHKNYTQLYLSLLDSEDCMSAAAIFARHFDSICEDMTSNTVQIFLQKIPNIDPTHMLPCLRHFIPKFVQRIPSALQQIVDWVKRKTLSFEGCYKSLWPDIGRDFCEAILEILHMVDQDSNHPTVADSILDDLLTLNKSLEELIILKEQFSINCSSGRYMKNDFTDVALILMKQVPTNHIETFLKDFLIPRLCIRNIDLNDLLNKHISDCLKKRDKDQQWESKMCSFALHITDELVAMQCILKILKSAKLPWSAIIMDLYERGASSQHPLSSEIRGAHQLTALRFIENKYCFEECADEDDLLLLVERILYVNELEAMKDIHKVIGAQPEMESCIYRTALCHYIHQGNFEKCINIIYNLADIDSRTGLCLYVIQMCEIILQTKKPLNKPELSFFEFLNFVKQESLCVNEKNLNKIEVFEKIVKLKTKYDIHFNYGDYYHYRSGFEEVLNELIPKIINNYQGFDEIFASLQEIAYLCDIKLEVVLIELCKQTLNLGLILHCIGKLLVTQTIYNSTDNKREKFVVLAAHLVNIYGREDINMQIFF